MNSLWSDSHVGKIADNPLQLRVYSSRLLGQDPDLVLHGGGNTSVKITEKDLFGQDEEILYVKGSGWDLGDIEAEGFAPVKLKILQHMAGLESLTDSDMVSMQRAAMTNPYAPNPSVEAVLHAIIPFKFVDHTHADAVVTITNTPNGEDKIKQIYGERVLIVPYVMPGFVLAKKIYEMTRDIEWTQYDGMVLLNHGVFSFDDDAKASYEKMIEIVSRAEDYIAANTTSIVNADNNAMPDLQALAVIRQQVSTLRGSAVYALMDNGAEACSYASLDNVDAISSRGPLTPDHIIRTKQLPLMIDQGDTEVNDYADAYQAYFDKNASQQQVCLDRAPRWAVWKHQGLISFGTSLKEANIISDISGHTIQAIQMAEQLGGWQALPENDLFDMEYWELEQAKLNKSKTSPEFQGKIALVTGAGSGIGKACVEALLEKGAAVAALDIDPAIRGTFNRQEVLEIVCDVTDDAVLKNAVEETVRHFGGLDILVTNAGIFTANENIEDMNDDTWQLAMDVNLTSHQRLMKYGIPYLRHGIEPAIIIIASKNVPAPGPGASAYSAAKAGLTQLARVAAFELGKDNIRVNTIHPNAVFDTAVWSEEMLEGRAKNYGISVEEYKANNVLHTEVTSKNVAEMACAMAGRAFAKTTGSQVPVDGGNDRVI
ncbi:MAG: bifunctional aldolase/short-chain dehydrogenase [Gammaproteobacteria bacterium]|nr:bifunctional aldolase/short-chain dehydrogenase [Gammaproteobacteria bacterium]MCW8923478.1 bifunctional aldolase/short-chain dehydrogenase [Gammaproteobacteria bacterium]